MYMTELRPVLVRPFLNDKAKAVVGKLGPEVLGDYERLKAAVLKEFKLSPNVYLNRLIHIGKSIVKVTWHLLQG